jgi:hypothetical protein
MTCVRVKSSFGNCAFVVLDALFRATGFGLHLVALLNPARAFKMGLAEKSSKELGAHLLPWCGSSARCQKLPTD